MGNLAYTKVKGIGPGAWAAPPDLGSLAMDRVPVMRRPAVASLGSFSSGALLT